MYVYKIVSSFAIELTDIICWVFGADKTSGDFGVLRTIEIEIYTIEIEWYYIYITIITWICVD